MSGEIAKKPPSESLDLERRAGPPAREGLPNELREAILDAVKRIQEVLPPQMALRLEFGSAVDHLFREDGTVGYIEGPREVNVEVRAEAPLSVDGLNLIEGASAYGRVLWRDGEFDIVLLSWDHLFQRAWPG